MVRVENEGVLATLEARQQIRLRQLDQPDGHARAAARPRPRRNQLETSPRRTCRLKTRGADACDAFAIDCMETAIVPGIYDPTLADENLRISTERSYELVRRLAREMGLMAGISSGAAVAAMLDVAKGLKQGVLVTIFPDGAEKYLNEAFWTVDSDAA